MLKIFKNQLQIYTANIQLIVTILLLHISQLVSFYSFVYDSLLIAGKYISSHLSLKGLRTFKPGNKNQSSSGFFLVCFHDSWSVSVVWDKHANVIDLWPEVYIYNTNHHWPNYIRAAV